MAKLHYERELCQSWGEILAWWNSPTWDSWELKQSGAKNWELSFRLTDLDLKALIRKISKPSSSVSWLEYIESPDQFSFSEVFS
jgi:hypothetical protein